MVTYFIIRPVIVKKGGNLIKTNYQLIGSNNITAMVRKDRTSKPESTSIDVKLLSLEPITLKTYQMRASCFSLDAPIIGDKKYNSNIVRVSL